MIYFIIQQDRYVKIGFTEENPNARLVACQTGNPMPLQLYKVIQGDMLKERELHEMFDNIRISGEWFYFTDGLKKHIDSIIPADFHSGYADLVMEVNALADWDRFKFENKAYLNSMSLKILDNLIDKWKKDRG